MTTTFARAVSATGAWAYTVPVVRYLDSAGRVAADPPYRILRSPSGPIGPEGLAAAQDLGWSIANGLGAGEVVDAPMLERAATYAKVKVFSRTGVAVTQTIAILLNGVQAAVVTITPDTLPTKQVFAIGPVAASENDVLSLRLPNPADTQLRDFTLSLGST